MKHIFYNLKAKICKLKVRAAVAAAAVVASMALCAVPAYAASAPVDASLELGDDLIPVADSMTMADFLANGTTMGQWLFTQVGVVADTVMASPVMSAMFYVALIGAAVGICGRLFRLA